MDRWEPWDRVERAPVELQVTRLRPGERGRWVRRAERDQILLADSLDRRTRREVLAHELIHAERGVGWPSASAATMELEEERVWREALHRLAPPDEVRRFLATRGTVGAVTVHDLAEEFDLSLEAAGRVAALLALEGPPSVGDDA